MTTPQEHRRLREMLGAYVLGGLPEDEATALRAHLDGCAACRAELAEIAPMADALRGVDSDVLTDLPTPPPDLGERLLQRVGEERTLVQARARREQRRHQARQRTRLLLTAAAAVVVLTTAIGLGGLIGRATAPEMAAPPTPPIPLETVQVSTASGVQAETADVIAHTWGVEARFEGTGFDAGEVYRAAFRSTDGTLRPAGQFLGTGAEALKCNMQSALLRPDTDAFLVMDDTGRTVLTADLTA